MTDLHLHDDDGTQQNALKGGKRLKFVDGNYSDGGGNPIAVGTELAVIATDIILQRWTDGMASVLERDPVTRRLPDPEELNEQIPQNEWKLDLNGKPRPPWAYTYCVYLLDLDSGQKFSFVSDTYGLCIAYRELRDKIKNKSLIFGVDLIPVVALRSVWWKPKAFAKRLRPDFHPTCWLRRGDDGALAVVNDQLRRPENRIGGAPPVPALPATANDLDDSIPF
jgi:hypothetical protein